jgi:hypothetical protein
LLFYRAKRHFIKFEEQVFENNLVLTQEELFGERKTVILDFKNFLLWRDWLNLQNVHKVVNFIEEFVSI